jgi:hypothetical protein
MRRVIVSATALGAVAIGVGVCAPNLVLARKHGNEAATIGGLKVVHTDCYREGDKDDDGNLDYGMLSELNNTRLVDSVIGSGTKAGYFFQASGSANTSEYLWFGLANPSVAGTSASNQAGVVFNTDGVNLQPDTDTCILPNSGVIPTGKGGPAAPSRAAGPSADNGAADIGAADIAAAGVAAARRLATTPTLRPRPPELLARTNGTDEEPLPLESLKIDAVLGPTRARILVDCTFKNPSSRQLEGTFLVALPEGASPCYLGTFQGAGPALADPAALVPPATDPGFLLGADFRPLSEWKSPAPVEWGTLRAARVVEQAQGKVVYEQVTRRRVDPALMEWSGGNRFSTRIFPIPGGSRKRVVFAFDEAPCEERGCTVLTLPVPNPLPAAARIDVAADRSYSEPVLFHGKAETPLRGEPFARASVEPTKDDDAYVLAAKPRSPSVRAGFMRNEALGSSLVHARIAPRVKAPGDRPTHDAVFLLDTSRSQRTTLAPVCGKLLRSILEQDTTIERFRVVGFDVRARDMTDGYCANTPAEREKLFARVESLWLEGATNLDAALGLLDETVPADEHPVFFLLSDGEITWGVDDPRELERAHGRIFSERWIAYQIGDAPVNRALVDRLTSNGRTVTVAAPSDVAKAALAHRTAPVALEGVHVEGAAASDLLVPGEPRALFPGQVLEVAFRLPASADPAQTSLVLETSAGAQRFSLEGAVADDQLAGRAWAEVTANALLGLHDAAADGVAVALSQRFALANRVASFLILETDAEYAAHAIDAKALDVAALSKAARAREATRPSCAPDLAALSPSVRAFLETVRTRCGKGWRRPDAPPPGTRAFAPPTWPDRLDPRDVHREAERRARLGKPEEALRILSSILEDNPRDEKALRLTGYALLSWGLSEEAVSVFARTRELRPFEPQAWLCEALALEATGLIGEAAVRYELVLAGRFDTRYDGFAKAAATRLYARLLRGLGPEGAARAGELCQTMPTDPAFETVLFWNLDDTDVDLHVIERGGHEVFYSARSSSSGGLLHWDNTAGLGPEIYTHPTSEPEEAFVDYYGTSSVAGVVPAATLLVTFGREGPRASCAVLSGRRDRTVLWHATVR